MNNFSKTFFTAGLCATLALSGCTSDFGSINTDRNNPTEVTADLLLLPIMHTFIMDQFNYGDGTALAHQLSRTNYNETEQYAFGTNESTWSRYYLQLNDIQDMYNVAGKNGQPSCQAIALIWKAFAIAQLTDLWGDVPYFEATQGGNNITPAYDTQEDIYTADNGIIDLLKADMSLLDGDSTAADSLYAVALEREAVTEPVVISLICLHYGRFCEDRGMNGKAAELYRKGLAISDRYANMELRNELQLHLADVSYELGDMKGSLSNYRASHLGQVRSQEWELNDLRMSYQEVLHKQEVQAKELDLVKSRRLILVVIFVLIIVAVVSVFFIVLFRRQRRLNRTLVDQYRSYMQRTQQKQPAEEADRHLWEKVERMMNVDKLYLRKDLTLESMAQELATNRTYLSKAVNAFSGGNFSSYVDRLRIREAVGIIEARGGAVDLKELGPAVGYSSVTAFYRAFSKETGLSPGKYREEIQRRR